MTLPFMYVAGITALAYLAQQLDPWSQQIGDISSGGYFLIFLAVPRPPDLVLQHDQGDDDGHRDRAGRLLLRLPPQEARRLWAPRPRNPVVLNIVLVHIIGMLGTLVFWGGHPEGANRWIKERTWLIDGEQNPGEGRGTEMKRRWSIRRAERRPGGPAPSGPPAVATCSEDGAMMGQDYLIPGVLIPKSNDPTACTPAQSATTGARTRSRSSTSSSSSAAPGS